MALVSTKLHVSVTVKRSPTLTAFRSVFHQHAIGSTSTSPGACGFGAGRAGAGFGRAGAGGAACGAPAGFGAACPATRGCTAPIAAMKTKMPTLDLMYPSTELAQPPLADEFHERGFHFPSIQPDTDDVEIGVPRQAHDLLLPLFDPEGEPRKLTP